MDPTARESTSVSWKYVSSFDPESIFVSSVRGECNDADDLLNATACPNMIAPDAALYTLHRSEWADEVIL